VSNKILSHTFGLLGFIRLAGRSVPGRGSAGFMPETAPNGIRLSGALSGNCLDLNVFEQKRNRLYLRLQTERVVGSCLRKQFCPAFSP
jgi:hypothetical protein